MGLDIPVSIPDRDFSGFQLQASAQPASKAEFQSLIGILVDFSSVEGEILETDEAVSIPDRDFSGFQQFVVSIKKKRGGASFNP